MLEQPSVALCKTLLEAYLLILCPNLARLEGQKLSVAMMCLPEPAELSGAPILIPGTRGGGRWTGCRARGGEGGGRTEFSGPGCLRSTYYKYLRTRNPGSAWRRRPARPGLGSTVGWDSECQSPGRAIQTDSDHNSISLARRMSLPSPSASKYPVTKFRALRSTTSWIAVSETRL